MDPKEYLGSEKVKVEARIEEFFERETGSVLQDENARRMLEDLRQYTLRGGKRVRAIFLVLGYRAVGGNDLEKAYRASIAMELIHTMLLIHDDIMDEATVRRGEPAMQVIYSERHRRAGHLGDSEKFGRDSAIIAGDLAEALGERALVSCGLPPERVLRALRRQTEMVRDTGLGQLFDLLSETGLPWGEREVLRVHRYKTAVYTVEAPLLIGAELAGADEEQLRALSCFGTEVGTAFQIVDDIIGLFGEPGMSGDKSTTSDLSEGKRTLLIVKALERSTPEDRKRLLSILGRVDIGEEEAEAVRGIVRSSGSLEYSRRRAHELTEKGLSCLSGAGLEPEVVEVLSATARYINGRAEPPDRPI